MLTRLVSCRPVLLMALTVVLAMSHTAGALEPPPLQHRVNDLAALLSVAQQDALENRLAEFEQQTGHQLALLTVPTLQGESIESFSIHAAERWKLGRAKKDDGVLLVVAAQEHRVRIEVGYGLEGELPDAVCHRIIEEEVVPAFKGGNYAEGLDRAVSAILVQAGGQAPPGGRVVARHHAIPAPAYEPMRLKDWSLLLLLCFLLMARTLRYCLRARRRKANPIEPVLNNSGPDGPANKGDGEVVNTVISMLGGVDKLNLPSIRPDVPLGRCG